MKRSLPQKDRRHVCKFSKQDPKGHWHCSLLKFLQQPCVILTPRGRIESTTSSTHKLLQQYWPSRTRGESRLPLQIERWMNLVRKQKGTKDISPAIAAPLVVNRLSTCLTVRYLCEDTCSALLFEERVVELPTDHLVSLGLTSREAEVVQWLPRGKSSYEIAKILNISERTVSKHLGRVYQQLGVENRHAAVALMHEEMKRMRQR